MDHKSIAIDGLSLETLTVQDGVRTEDLKESTARILTGSRAAAHVACFAVCTLNLAEQLVNVTESIASKGQACKVFDILPGKRSGTLRR